MPSSALVVLQRLGELVLAKRNTKALKARGAVEIGAGHYPLDRAPAHGLAAGGAVAPAGAACHSLGLAWRLRRAAGGCASG